MNPRKTFPLLCCLALALATLALPAGADNNTKNDQEMVLKAGHGGHGEIHAGNLAKTKASNAGVKQFGEMMVTDHTKANQELETAAKAAGLTVPADTDAKHKEMFDKLSMKSGADFDKAYIDDMVKGHKEMENLLQKMSKNAGHAQLRDWATRTLPAVQSHLKRAQELQDSLR